MPLQRGENSSATGVRESLAVTPEPCWGLPKYSGDEYALLWPQCVRSCSGEVADCYKRAHIACGAHVTDEAKVKRHDSRGRGPQERSLSRTRRLLTAWKRWQFLGVMSRLGDAPLQGFWKCTIRTGIGERAERLGKMFPRPS